MALLACLCSYQHLFAGLTNRSLRELIGTLIPGCTARQMTYDLRRLRRRGFIQRIPHAQRYQLTREGGRLVFFFTKTHTRIVNPSLASSAPTYPARSPRSRPSHNPGGRSNARSISEYNEPLSRPEQDDQSVSLSIAKRS